MPSLKENAKRALGLVDLTDLTDDCTPQAIDDLCARAQSPHGPVAAVCIWPQFIAQAVPLLKDSEIDIATVVNFPHGGEDTNPVCGETESALADGASEIDLVMPYKALITGKLDVVETRVKAIRDIVPSDKVLKVIIESGELKTAAFIQQASQIALDCGADFIKTSTGKVPVNATLETARIMLNVLKESGYSSGFKAAGGIRTSEDAADYLALADEIMGADWATKSTFRFGASSVLSALLATLNGDGNGNCAEPNTSSY